MDVVTADSYWRAITVIEAQDVIMNLRIAIYPNLKRHVQSSFHRQMHRLAYPDSNDSKRTLSNEEVARRIGVLVSGQ